MDEIAFYEIAPKCHTFNGYEKYEEAPGLFIVHRPTGMVCTLINSQCAYKTLSILIYPDWVKYEGDTFDGTVITTIINGIRYLFPHIYEPNESLWTIVAADAAECLKKVNTEVTYNGPQWGLPWN